MRLHKVLLAAAAAAFHFSAQASLVNPLEYNDGTRTWLKLSETVGLSMADFNAGIGGWSSSYRLASEQEITSLLAGFGVAEGDSGYRTSVPGAGNVVHLLGGNANGYYSGTWGVDGNQGAIGRGTGWYVSVELTNGDAPVALGPYCPAYFSCSRVIALHQAQSVGERGTVTGLFVVRNDSPADVPEPSSLALVGLAGGLLACQRRKKRQ